MPGREAGEDTGSLDRSRGALLRAALRLSLRAFAAHLGVAERTVSKWEKAGRSTTPWPESQAILDTALAHASDEAQARFVRLAESGALADASGRELSAAATVWAADSVKARAAAVALWSAEETDPSSIDGAMQTASHSVIFKWLLARQDNDVDTLSAGEGARQISHGDVTALHAMKRSLATLDDEHGGSVALPLILKYLHNEVTPLLHGRFPDRLGRQLFAAAAELALLAGWTAYDAGQHGHARKQMLQALRLSQVADDRLFGGRVLVAMSHQALHIGQLQDGIDFAAAASQGAKAAGLPTATALFTSCQARALAASGDKQASLNLMHTAEQALGRARTDDGPPWLGFMDEAELAGKLGRCFRDLGMHNEAERHLDTSLALHKVQYLRSRAITKIIHATNYVRQSELERACQLGLEALPEIGRLRSQRTKEYLTDLYRGLDNYHDEPLVQTFRDQAKHLVMSDRL